MDGTWQWILTFAPREVPPGAPPRPTVDPNLFMPGPQQCFAMVANTPIIQSQYDQWLASGKGAAFCDKGFGKGGFDEVGAGMPIHPSKGCGIEEMFDKGCGRGSEKIGKGFGNDGNQEDMVKGIGKGFGKDHDLGFEKGKMDAETSGKAVLEDEDVAKNSKKRQAAQVPAPLQPKSKARPLTPTPPQIKPPPHLEEVPGSDYVQVLVEEPESEAAPSSSASGSYYEKGKETYQREWNWNSRKHPWHYW